MDCKFCWIFIQLFSLTCTHTMIYDSRSYYPQYLPHAPEFTSKPLLTSESCQINPTFLNFYFLQLSLAHSLSPFSDVVPVCSSVMTMCATVLTTALSDHFTFIKDNILPSTIQLFRFSCNKWLLMITLHILKQNSAWENIALIPICSIFSLFPSLSWEWDSTCQGNSTLTISPQSWIS